MIIADTFNLIAAMAQLQGLSSLGCTNSGFYSIWNEYLLKHDNLISTYVQSLLEKKWPPDEIESRLQRFPNASYNNPLTITLSPSQAGFKSLEQICKKFPNIQQLAYSRPQYLDASTPIRSKTAALLTIVERPWAFVTSLVFLAPTLIAICISEDKELPFVQKTVRVFSELKSSLARDLYLEKTCLVFSQIEKIKIVFKKSDEAGYTLLKLPHLPQIKHIVLHKEHDCDNNEEKYLTNSFAKLSLNEQLPVGLEKLTLSGTLPTFSDRRALANILATCTNLVSLNLKRLNTYLFYKKLPNISTSIRELKVDDNALVDWHKGLFSTFPNLLKLKIRMATDWNSGTLPCSTTLKQLTITSENIVIVADGVISNTFERFQNLEVITEITKKPIWLKTVYPLVPDGYDITHIEKNGKIGFTITRKKEQASQ